MIKLSDREREVLLLASQGSTDKAIASKLNLSPRTVATYWERLRDKTEGLSRTHIVMSVLGRELEKAAAEALEARAERDFLLEQAEGYAVFSIDLQGKILEWNSGVLKVLGFERDEFVGHHFSLVFTPEDIERGIPEVEMKGAREHGRFLEERFHIRKDGRHIWVDGTLVAIYGQDKSIRKFSKIMRDDSKKKSLEDQVQLLQSKLPDRC